MSRNTQYGAVDTHDGYREDDHWEIRLFVIQCLLLVLSLSAFSICIWIRFDLDFWEWCLEIEWYTYWYCSYVVMIGMLIKAGTLVLGAWSVHTMSRSLLLLCVFLHMFTFIMHLVGTILICVYGTEESTVLIAELNEVLMKVVYAWDVDPRKSRILKQIMEYIGCCGAGGSSDFTDVYKPIPMECRHPITGNEWSNGCDQQMAFYLEPWSGTLAGIGIFMCLTDIFLPVLYIRHRASLDRDGK